MTKREGEKLAIIAVLGDVGKRVGWSQYQGQEKAWFSFFCSWVRNKKELAFQCWNFKTIYWG
jgi:hypothetical protein